MAELSAGLQCQGVVADGFALAGTPEREKTIHIPRLLEKSELYLIVNSLPP